MDQEVLQPSKIAKQDTLLRSGQTVYMEDGSPCQVEQFLGSGGQGETYRVNCSGELRALKWYYPSSTTEQDRARLKDVVHHGSPHPRFLWPLAVVSAPDIQGFGFLMPLRGPSMKGLTDLLTGRITPSFSALAKVGFDLADGIWRLHARGFCYRSLNFGAVLFNPDTGGVVFDDCEWIVAEQDIGPVLGNPEFEAPEVVRGEAKSCRQAELHSLAVLLFYLLHLSHPLAGKKILSERAWDFAASIELYGTEPLFIFDPNDRSNEAVDRSVDPMGSAGANALLYWPIYPLFLRHLFTRAFTVGLHAPAQRVSGQEWRAAFSRLRDSLFYCALCGRENFLDCDALKASDGKPGDCWSCGKELVLPFRICIGTSLVTLPRDAKLFPHHLDPAKDFDFTRTCGELGRHPSAPDVWGLKNCTGENWTVMTPDGTLLQVLPGRHVGLRHGVTVDFGNARGTIRYGKLEMQAELAVDCPSESGPWSFRPNQR